jgi:hypothetical protein
MLSRNLRERFKWKTRLWKSRDPARELTEFKENASLATIAEMMPEIVGSHLGKYVHAKECFPKDYSSIASGQLLNAMPFARELYWSAQMLQQHHEELVRFINARESIERAVCSGDFEGALTFLENMELTLGCSFWSLQMKIALLGAGRGLEAQKDFTAGIKSNPNANPLIRAFAYFCSLCSEPNVSFARYDTYVKDLIKKNAGASSPGKHLESSYVSY